MKRTILFLMFLPLALASLPLLAESTEQEALCPVCRVHEGESDLEPVLATADFRGKTYGFCSSDCRDKFLEAPEAYLEPELPRPAPPFVVGEAEGSRLALEDLRGRTVLLDFWATWCQPCVKDLPDLTRLHERYEEKGLTVLSVAIDEGADAADQVARMVKKRKATHPVFLDSAEAPAWAAYLVRVVPTQFLIDGSGNVVAQWSGKIDLDRVEKEIVRHLAPDHGTEGANGEP